jgi:hypothetical protein
MAKKEEKIAPAENEVKKKKPTQRKKKATTVKKDEKNPIKRINAKVEEPVKEENVVKEEIVKEPIKKEEPKTKPIKNKANVIQRIGSFFEYMWNGQVID